MNFYHYLLCFVSAYSLTTHTMKRPREDIQTKDPEFTLELSSVRYDELEFVHSMLTDQKLKRKFSKKLTRLLTMNKQLYDLVQVDTDEAHRGVAHLLLNGADLRVHDMQGCTPLLKACEAGNYEAVQLLVEQDACTNIQDVFSHGALHYAIPDHASNRSASRLEIIRYLIQEGINKYAPTQYSPLRHAVIRGDLEACKAIILTLSPGNLSESIEKRIQREVALFSKELRSKNGTDTLYEIARTTGRSDIMELVNPNLADDQLFSLLFNANVRPVHIYQQ